MKRHALVIGALAAAGALAAFSVAGGAFAGKAPAEVHTWILPAMPEVYVGKKMVYNVLVQNRGGTEATGVSVDIDVTGGEPNLWKLKFSKLSCEIVSTSRVTCSGNLLPGRTAKIRVGIRPALSGSMTLRSDIAADVDGDGGNNHAAESTPIRPGRPGPPKVRNEDGPYGTVKLLEALTYVAGRFNLSEPGRVTVSVHDLTANLPVNIEPGSTLATVETHGNNVTVNVGNANVAPPDTEVEAPKLTYKFHLPNNLKTDHSYAIVAKAKDSENEESLDRIITFRLKKR